MKKINYVIAIVLGILVGIVIEQNNTINSLEAVNAVNESVETYCNNDEVHYHEEDYFWCDNCKESYNHYCEGCGQGKELWDKYYNEYVMMNYCEYCDTCYYKYCDCEGVEPYVGADFVEFTIEYDNYLHDYCTNYCEVCDEYYYLNCRFYDSSDFILALYDMREGINNNYNK